MTKECCFIFGQSGNKKCTLRNTKASNLTAVNRYACALNFGFLGDNPVETKQAGTRNHS